MAYNKELEEIRGKRDYAEYFFEQTGDEFYKKNFEQHQKEFTALESQLEPSK